MVSALRTLTKIGAALESYFVYGPVRQGRVGDRMRCRKRQKGESVLARCPEVLRAAAVPGPVVCRAG